MSGPGEFQVKVTFEEQGTVLNWFGYADNPTDALYHAINWRESLNDRDDELNERDRA